jgi:uncharacterized membrane protein YidH (DUF202 family)
MAKKGVTHQPVHHRTSKGQVLIHLQAFLVPRERGREWGKVRSLSHPSPSSTLVGAEGDRGLQGDAFPPAVRLIRRTSTPTRRRASVAQTYHKERRSSCLARLRRTWNRPVILLLCLGVAIEQLTTHFRRARSVSGETKTPIVVVVIRVVVVAVGATRIRSSVVPRAAAQHIVGQFLFVIIRQFHACLHHLRHDPGNYAIAQMRAVHHYVSSSLPTMHPIH